MNSHAGYVKSLNYNFVFDYSKDIPIYQRNAMKGDYDADE